MNPYFYDDAAVFFSLLLALVIIAINLLVFYLIIKAAIVHGMRRARREEWTETHDARNATWLTVEQRNTLASRAPQLEAETARSDMSDG